MSRLDDIRARLDAASGHFFSCLPARAGSPWANEMHVDQETHDLFCHVGLDLRDLLAVAEAAQDVIHAPDDGEDDLRSWRVLSEALDALDGTQGEEK